jgi:WD40 repeat protein
MRGASSALVAGCLACCGAPDPTDTAPLFVRGGWIATEPEEEGRVLSAGRHFVELAWKPGDVVRIGRSNVMAPARATCVALFHVPLGDIARLVAGGQGPRNTALAFSPDGSRLAVGSTLGEVVVADGWSGAVVARRSFAETVVKEVRWSPDGTTLYVGEQSPDAAVRALDPDSLEDRFVVPLSEIVGRSTVPKGADVYALYTLPTVNAIVPLAGGEVLAMGVHAWPDEEGIQHNSSTIVILDATGTIVRRWPNGTPADATFLHAHADPGRSWLALSVGRSASGSPPPEGLPVGGVQVLRLPSLEAVTGVTAEPMRPAFASTFVWDGVDASDEAVLAGFDDGRIVVRGLPGGEGRGALDTGAPVMAGDVPIYAGIGWARLARKKIVYATSGTRIPWGASDPARRPPTAHPQERSVAGATLEGEPLWRWTGEHEVQGLTVSPDGDELVVGSGDRETDHREDLYGALVFSLHDDGSSGDDRLETFCRTAGPVFFRHDLTADGRVAVTEHPFLDAHGDLVGDYRVTVLR